MSNGFILNDEGRKIILNRVFKTTPDYGEVTQFKVGIENTTPGVADTDLDKPIPVDSTESIDDCDTADWTDSADMTTTLNSTTYKEGSKSLNLTKDGTASANAETHKTTTSIDFTSKDFSIWIYIKDSTALGKLATSNCLTIRFGSDSSNYYVWTKDKADLSTGWNLIAPLNTSNADSTTGTPSLAAMDYTLVQLTADASATTWSAGDFIMDDIKAISSGDYLEDIDSTSPEIDETNKEVTITSFLSSVQANGYDINAIGFYNDDSTPKLFSTAVFTAESKSDTDEFSFTSVWRQL